MDWFPTYRRWIMRIGLPMTTRTQAQSLLRILAMGVAHRLALAPLLREFSRDERGVQHYAFSVPCDSEGAIVAWSMHDEPGHAIKSARIRTLKTVNGLLLVADHEQRPRSVRPCALARSYLPRECINDAPLHRARILSLIDQDVVD